MTVAVIGTYSRAGFLALCVMWLYQWWKSRHKLIFAAAVLLLAPPMIHFMPQAWRDRMLTIKNTSEDTMDGSAKGRLNAWRMGSNLFRDRPIVGGGFRTFVPRIFALYAPDPKNDHDAHSIYIETLAEQGAPGFLMFITLGLFTWLTGRRVVKTAKRLPELRWAGDLSTHTLVGLVGYAVGGAFAGLAYWDLPYQMMAIIVICGVLAKETARKAAWANARAAEAAPAWAMQEA
jgi:probable O-glycosylation ligase (exosortase A-associated)